MTLDQATEQFALLASLLELSRSQQRALRQQDPVGFDELMQRRDQLIDDLLVLRAEAAAPPANVVRLPTPLSLGDEADSLLALDLMVRLVLEQDAANEILLGEFGDAA